MSDAPQERVLVGLNLKCSEDRNGSFWFLLRIKWLNAGETNNTEECFFSTVKTTACGVCDIQTLHLFVVSQNMSLEDLLVGGCCLELRLI